ncbi:MAG: type II toxin-antitoxin system HicA family toxin [Ignavibacteriales bacterium]|nr:type II toxin-antitoxin system HicA family toxin [Ignavibacteriales bacterium]
MNDGRNHGADATSFNKKDRGWNSGLKRKEFLKELARNGCYFKRPGARHDIYHNPSSGRSAPVPRHSEIAESLCKLIRKQLGIEKEK